MRSPPNYVGGASSDATTHPNGEPMNLTHDDIADIALIGLGGALAAGVIR